ncbi:hypothetical protein [Actinomadura spongiicola]|uniref:hypothetical protein n=1 Tax=Actinomadura spongiicola TaxID=2303421 RepID=UPI0011C152A9|nr:hypothetical protein [Actinomadura spongiicola]
MKPEDNLQEKLEHIKAALVENENLNIPQDYVAQISMNTPYVRGTVVPALGRRWEVHPSGLLIPQGSARSIAPIDLVITYLTAEEVLGVKPEFEYVLDQLSRCTVRQVIAFTSRLMASYHAPGISRRELDKRFAITGFREPLREKILNLLRQGDRALIVPQALFWLNKISLIYSHDEPPAEVEPGNLVAALIAVTSHMSDESELPGSTIIDNIAGPLGREVIANQILNQKSTEANVLASFHRRWNQLPQELMSDPRVIDLAATFEEFAGVSLEDFSAVAAGFFASALKGEPVVPRSYFSSLDGQIDVNGVLELISRPVSTLRDEVTKEIERYGLTWAISTFERWPVVSFDDQNFIVIDGELLLQRCFGWLPMYDILDGLSGLSGSQGKRLTGKIQQCVSHLAEVYVLEILRSIVAELGDGKRAFFEEAIMRAYGGEKRKTCDAAIDYGSSWVMVEVTTIKMRRESVAGLSDEAINGDIDHLIAKAKQIDATIKAIQVDESRLTGHHSLPGKKFFPILVTAAGFPANPITLTLLRSKLKERGILEGPNVYPVELATTEELEMIEGLTQQHGYTLQGILESKAKAGLRRAAIREYILVELGVNPRRSERVERLWSKSFDSTIEALGRHEHPSG